MNDAVELFYYVLSQVYNFLFNQAVFTSGVSIGWVVVVVIIFIIIINSILNIPRV